MSKDPQTHESLSLPLDQVICGDAARVLKGFPDRSVDLIFTSPPYGDNRKRTYQGPRLDDYVDWFLPIAEELKRVLKADGSFVLNIKERADNGERHTYVLELILALRGQGWRWVEEYIWHKKNCYPGKWPNRFRDAWERCLHFTLSKDFKMFQDAVRVPIGDWASTRLANLSEEDRQRREPGTLSGFGRKVANWIGRDTVYPTNVLRLATECSNRGHSATFPQELPAWFIRLFTAEGDMVLDPFMGSGTTALASIANNRSFVGIELNRRYVQLAHSAIQQMQAKPNETVQEVRLRKVHRGKPFPRYQAA